MKSTSLIRIGSRQSALAMAQTQQVVDCVNFNTEYEIVPIVSTGDKIAGPLRDHGGKSLFTKELDLALLNGTIDLAIHSMKDVETPLHKGLEIAAVPLREDARDILIYRQGLNLDNLPANAKIGTSSLRRGYQLNFYFKNIEIVPCRGNIQTRLQKFQNKEMAGIILAVSGLKRMGLLNNGSILGVDAQTQILDHEKHVPAAGQGALVILKRKGDKRFDDALLKINHATSRLMIELERKVIEGLNVTCHDPIGVYAQMHKKEIQLKVMLFDKNDHKRVAPIIMQMSEKLPNFGLCLEIFIESVKRACEFRKYL